MHTIAQHSSFQSTHFFHTCRFFCCHLADFYCKILSNFSTANSFLSKAFCWFTSSFPSSDRHFFFLLTRSFLYFCNKGSSLNTLDFRTVFSFECFNKEGKGHFFAYHISWKTKNKNWGLGCQKFLLKLWLFPFTFFSNFKDFEFYFRGFQEGVILLCPRTVFHKYLQEEIILSTFVRLLGNVLNRSILENVNLFEKVILAQLL